MAIATNTGLKKTVADCQSRTKQAAERLLKTFRFVPDSKLKWSPSKSAHNSIGIVAHCCMANRMFARVLRGESLSPMPTLKEIHEMSQKFEATVRTRAVAVRLLNASCKEAVAALGTMTPKRLATSPTSPMGALPMAFWMNLPGMHMSHHKAQIDYIQTIWGDLVDHA